MSVSWRYMLMAGAASALLATPAAGGDKPKPPPSHCCKHDSGHKVRTPDIHVGAPKVHIGGTKVKVHHGGVFVSKTHVNVDVQASAAASARASGDVFVSGGGGGFFSPAPAPALGAINICIEEKELVEKTRLVEAMLAIRAACIDDRGAPHPAARLSTAETVAAGFEGELYRCPAGSYLQVTLGDAKGGYHGGSTIVCEKGEALYHASGGQLVCRPQTPQRDCFERSLLRKYGPGSKVVKIKREETYTETVAKTCPPDASGILLSGGVGAY